MLKKINKILFYLKIFFLLIAFSFNLYIALMKMDATSSNLLTVLPIFIPFLILLILFVFGLLSTWYDKDIYYHIIEILVFIAIIIIAFRTIFDKNIIAYPNSINLNFFNAYEGKVEALLYLMIIGSLVHLYYQKKNEV